MIHRDEKKRVRDEDKKILKEVTRNRETLVAKRADEVERRYKGIEDQIKNLHDQKMELLDEATTKKELLENALERLRSGREDMINALLVQELKRCQERNDTPFNHTNLKVYLLPEDKVWKLFFFAVTEKDIKRAVDQLPDIGMSEEDRRAKIEDIDKKILDLSKGLEDDLKK